MTDIVERLRATPNWKREECRHWKDVTCVYDRSPFEAADEIERLRAELSWANIESTALLEAMLRQDGNTDCVMLTTAGGRITQISNLVAGMRAERDALLALLTEVRCYVEQDDSGLSRKGKADMELLDRIDAARKGEG